MTINSTDIRLRALEPDDVDCIYLWENDPRMWRYGYAPAPLSRHLIWDYIHTYDADPFRAGQLRLIVECHGEPAGAVDLYDVDARHRRAMVGIMVDERYRRQGVGERALDLLHGYCRDTLGLNQLGAIIEAGNIASRGLFLAAGYRECGVLCRWFRTGKDFSDAVMFQLML